MNEKEFDFGGFRLTANNTMQKVIKTVYSIAPVPDVVKNSHIYNGNDYWKNKLSIWLSMRQVTKDGIERTTYYQKAAYGTDLLLEITKQPEKDELFIEIIAFGTEIRLKLYELWKRLDKIAKIQ